jgi:hypothetical protein
MTPSMLSVLLSISCPWTTCFWRSRGKVVRVRAADNLPPEERLLGKKLSMKLSVHHESCPPLISGGLITIGCNEGRVEMPIQITCGAKKLKVMTLLDPAAFVALGAIAEPAPARALVTVTGPSWSVRADIATKSLRRAQAAIREHGPDGVVLLLQGTLAANGVIEEAGLAAQPKLKPALAAA